MIDEKREGIAVAGLGAQVAGPSTHSLHRTCLGREATFGGGATTKTTQSATATRDWKRGPKDSPVFGVRNQFENLGGLAGGEGILR